MKDLFSNARFPRAARYHPQWIMGNVSSGTNWLWLAEWLGEAMELRPGMRILDLGCGRACSSIFLAREFGVQVWAGDLWFDPAENWQRIQDAGVADAVFPLRLDARALPFAREFFDAIVSIDAYYYFGTDDMYFHHLGRFLKPGGQFGMAGAGLMQEIDRETPAHLLDWWSSESPNFFHSIDWWRRHFERTGIVEVELADTMPEGWRWWLDWQHTVSPENTREIAAVEADQGEYLGYTRLVARRMKAGRLQESPTSIPYSYTNQPLLRGS